MNASKAIEKMLVVSTTHISQKTAMWLSNGEYSGALFDKRDEDLFGWFIGINLDEPDTYLDTNIPEDLRAIFEKAAEEECWWICLDREGFEIDGLAKYQWD